MQKVQIKSLEVKNFKSFSEASLSFPSDGLVSLQAKNLDTTGSSGAGKSNLNNAIAFALGYADAPATTLQNWNTEEPMQVVLTLDTPEGDVVVGRGHKNYLKMGKQNITGAKSIEEGLRRVFGVSPETLKALVYRPQGSGGLFLSMDDADKKDFLGKVLDLERFDSAIDASKKALSEANLKLSTAQGIYGSAKQFLDSYPVRVAPTINELVIDEKRDKAAELEQESKSALDDAASAQATIEKFAAAYKTKREATSKKFSDQIAELEPQISSYWSNYSYAPDTTEIDECKKKLDLITPRIAKAKEAHEKALAEYRVASQAITKSITQAGMAAKQVAGLKQKLALAEKQLETLKGGVCYVCHRDGFFEQHTVDSVTAEIQTLTKQLDDASTLAARVPEFEKALSELKEPSSDIHSKMMAAQATEQAKLFALQSALKTKEEQHKKDFAAGCEGLQGQVKLLKAEQQSALSELESKYQSAVNGLREKKSAAELRASNTSQQAKSVQTELKAMFDQYEQSRKFFEGFSKVQNQFTEAENNLTETTKLVELESKMGEMLKGFVGSIFEEILNEIADETNTILATIPNVAHCSIQFNTEAVSQKGTVKQRITPLVNVSGHITPLKAGCSGGMVSAIELAVDIAVGNVIMRRTGASPQWLVLDEAFDGFDTVVKEACLEILQKHANDKLIIVVSHISEFKEFFSRSIWVEYQNGESRIVNDAT